MNIFENMSLIMEDEEKEKYFRLTIDGKSFFRSVNSILREFEDSTDEQIISAYDDLDRVIAELEYELPLPNIKNKKTNFAYKEKAVENLEDKIDTIDYCLQILGHELHINEVFPKEIVYEDEYQIAYL